MLYELWKNTNEMTFLPFDHPQKECLTKGMEKIWEIEADDFVKASILRNEHLGWGPYLPFDDMED